MRRWLLAGGAPLLVAVVWATLVTTSSTQKLDDPWRLVLEIAIFGAGAAALARLERPTWALRFAMIAFVHLALTFARDQR
jgi:hypothetical protein